MYTVVLDAMGGDFDPLIPVKAAILAVEGQDKLNVILTGPKDELTKLTHSLSSFPHDKISIVDAPEVIEMSESPSKAFRKKKKSSIHVGLELVKSKKADAFVSAGNTGAMLTASTFILGRLPHVERPALAAVIPSIKAPFVMLDMGSNVDCKPSHIAQFSLMGHYFSELILGTHKPRVGLLNIGEERDKGNALTTESYSLLEKLPINFIGNIESKGLLNGVVDVLVCDGFVGNNILKFGEGAIKLFTSFFKKEAKRSIFSLIGLLLLRSSLKKFKSKFSYDNIGGAHFLGVDGVSIVAHGSANEIALKNAIYTAVHSLETNITQKISSAILNFHIQSPSIINNE